VVVGLLIGIVAKTAVDCSCSHLATSSWTDGAI
jgi:hypothetical protein